MIDMNSKKTTKFASNREQGIYRNHVAIGDTCCTVISYTKTFTSNYCIFSRYIKEGKTVKYNYNKSRAII